MGASEPASLGKRPASTTPASNPAAASRAVLLVGGRAPGLSAANPAWSEPAAPGTGARSPDGEDAQPASSPTHIDRTSARRFTPALCLRSAGSGQAPTS